jgi:hypothetical protein
MKILEKNFERKIFNYEQLYRKGNLAIYAQKNKETGSATYEVIIIKSHNGYEIGGVKIEPSEVYPGDSQWGILGWTCQTMEAAKNKINKLEENNESEQS